MRKYPSIENQEMNEWQRWNGGSDVELSVLRDTLQQAGLPAATIERQLWETRKALAVQCYQYGRKHGAVRKTLAKLLCNDPDVTREELFARVLMALQQ